MEGTIGVEDRCRRRMESISDRFVECAKNEGRLREDRKK